MQIVFFGCIAIVVGALVLWALQAPQTKQSKQQPVGAQHLTDEEESVVARYNALYQEVPLWGGKEWRTLGIDDLVAMHHDAAKLLALYHDVPEAVIVKQMIDRAESLSDWMATNQYRPFYEGSDMRAFIDGPRAVAEALKKKG